MLANIGHLASFDLVMVDSVFLLLGILFREDFGGFFLLELLVSFSLVYIKKKKKMKQNKTKIKYIFVIIMSKNVLIENKSQN